MFLQISLNFCESSLCSVSVVPTNGLFLCSYVFFVSCKHIVNTNVLHGPYLMVFAVPIDHPVLSISADFQFEGGDVVGLMGLLRNGSLGSDPGQYLEEVKIHLGKESD